MALSENIPALSVVIPVFNEEDNVDLLYQRLHAALSGLGSVEYIFVNDGSQDETLPRVRALRDRDPSVKYLSFSRNFGHQVAVTAGLDVALGRAVVIIDADLQDPPEVIPELYKKFEEGFDVVYAVRSQRRGEGFLKKLTAKIFYRLLRFLTGFSIPVDVGDFRLMSRRSIEVFNKLRERHRYVRGMVSWLGFRQTGVSYIRDPRHSGETKYSVGKMFKLATDGITSFSNVPLQFAGHLGFWISGGSLFYILYIVAMKLFTDKPVIGWASTMTAIIFFGGIQMMTLGVIGEYIGRISDEVKQRPIYIVAETGGIAS
ncbi:MAG: glycosyltransferase family 2 protein [Deltaproteobacteria bacterium]|nr:glycosyltransferase family 2 protein [Deltaproteobacteria bacterium]